MKVTVELYPLALIVPFNVALVVVIEVAALVVTEGVNNSPTSKSLKLVRPVAVMVVPETELVTFAQLASYLFTLYSAVLPVLEVLVKSNVASYPVNVPAPVLVMFQ